MVVGGELSGIKMYDHIIISAFGYSSLADEGMI